MAHTHRRQRHGRRAFLSLVAMVMVSGGLLWSQGDLISPFQSTTMLISLSSGEPGFVMAGETVGQPDAAADTIAASSTEAEDVAVVETTAQNTADETTTGTMTMEMLVAELTAAGVDVEAVTADMTAEGRSLDNLLVVVNSGRVTVADLATRLQGESPASATPAPSVKSAALLDIHLDEIGSVLYDLWFILAVTVAVIVLARPVGWLVNRIQQAQRTATPDPVLS